MALEKSLWQRVRRGGVNLRACGHGVHLCRIENQSGTGNPDVDGCINGQQIWLELKSEHRPKRASTPIRPKLRESQSIWHRERAEAGCRHSYILIQVGDGHHAKLYLIRGRDYDLITAMIEPELENLSLLPDTQMQLPEVLLLASEGYNET